MQSQQNTQNVSELIALVPVLKSLYYEA